MNISYAQDTTADQKVIRDEFRMPGIPNMDCKHLRHSDGPLPHENAGHFEVPCASTWHCEAACGKATSGDHCARFYNIFDPWQILSLSHLGKCLLDHNEFRS